MKQFAFICIIIFQLVNPSVLKSNFNKEAVAFRLIHINDIHAHFDQVSENVGRCKADQDNACFGGVARLKTAVDHIRNLKPEMDSIFLNAGDYYQVFIVGYTRVPGYLRRYPCTRKGVGYTRVVGYPCTRVLNTNKYCFMLMLNLQELSFRVGFRYKVL